MRSLLQGVRGLKPLVAHASAENVLSFSMPWGRKGSNDRGFEDLSASAERPPMSSLEYAYYILRLLVSRCKMQKEK